MSAWDAFHQALAGVRIGTQRAEAALRRGDMDGARNLLITEVKAGGMAAMVALNELSARVCAPDEATPVMPKKQGAEVGIRDWARAAANDLPDDGEGEA